ncbi:50S ribosomal protein L11 methyltransferase [Acetobacter thailandicus]|uniref:Ribosomal protein L11 methyltransferase n=1 Tax=Acetobacter thailandicus TaxID=1502842 RepID=A0ABT3QFK4_9PROT|nr:50S ribosomal protein L11 methyltransferase [Acetobacter thailandicus]MCX2564035.1 50S ribosomal protein L11 methyltransferase [Acetobacter thailandicus]NHN96065.1 methyltransferase domain-containing protein [Acetobacter thailandicus]
MTAPSRRHATALETVSVTIPESAVEAYENAIGTVCTTVGLFEANPEGTLWRVEGVKDAGHRDDELAAALALASLISSVDAPLHREATEAEGWLARTYESFPEQQVGQRFVIRGTHLPDTPDKTRIVLTLDAGVAFGSGEHGSTRGCLRALEWMAYRKPRRILDLGCGSGILAMAAAALLHRKVLAVDIEPWSVRVSASNAARNRLAHALTCRLGNGWRTPEIRHQAPYDLVFANILARPLCLMAKDMAINLAPGGTAILAGLLRTQIPMVLSAHRRQGLVLEKTFAEGDWATLVLRKPFALPAHKS